MSLGISYSSPLPPMVSAMTAGWGFASEVNIGSNPVSGGYEGSNVCVYIPINVPVICPVKRFWVAVSSSSFGALDLGIYNDNVYKPGNKIISTGYWDTSAFNQMITARVLWSDKINDLYLSPGLYWLAITADTNITIFRGQDVTPHRKMMRLQQSSVSPGRMPETATPVSSTNTSVYLFGFATRSDY